jgi:hypothetical protein
MLLQVVTSSVVFSSVHNPRAEGMKIFAQHSFFAFRIFIQTFFVDFGRRLVITI